MNSGRKSIYKMLLFPFILITAFLFILAVCGIIDDVLYSKIMSYAFVEFAFISTMIIAILAFLNSSLFDSFNPRKFKSTQTLFCIVCLSILCSITTTLNADVNPLYFNCTPVILFLICLWCGPLIGIPVALISSCWLFIARFDAVGEGTVTMILIQLVFAFCSSYVSKDEVPSKRRSIVAILVATLISIVIMIVYFVITNTRILEMHYHLCLMSILVMMVSVVFFILLLDLVEDVIFRLEENRKNKEELALAHDIQQSYLTKEFPSSHSMDIFAFMEPASLVGGDFYDIYRINPNLTFMVIADVSDKGLPASMLMMRAMGMIRSASSVSNDPGIILSILNRQLCESNPTGQFITAFVGVYDSDTGLFAYSNAGHTPPYIRHSDGKYERLQIPKGLIIGVNNSVKYKTDVITLKNRDAIFCYTDGVNEAFNSENQMFGHERLFGVLNDSSVDSDARSLINDVYDSVKAFTKGCEVSDDITMLSFIVHRDWYKHMYFDAKVENLDSVNEFIHSVLTEAGCSEKKILKMEIVSEEIFVNICDHAYRGKGGDVTVYCSYHENEIKMTFVDKATTFNPVLRDDLVIDDDINNWRIGGFGIHMVKELVTYMSYKRFSGLNILTVWSKVDESVGKDGA